MFPKYSANANQLRGFFNQYYHMVSTKQHKILDREGKDCFVSQMHKAWIPKEAQQRSRLIFQDGKLTYL